MTSATSMGFAPAVRQIIPPVAKAGLAASAATSAARTIFVIARNRARPLLNRNLRG
jgi:hypothetical protein